MPTLTYAIKENDPAGFEAYGGCAKLWRFKGPQAILSGPAQTGKTRAALEKLDALMWLFPGAQGAVVRKTRNSMTGSVLQTYEEKVLGGLRASPVKAYGGKEPRWYEYPNGSRIFVGGLDNPDKVLSSERDVIYVNQAEELTAEEWEVLSTRVTGRAGHMPYAQLFGDCNPAQPTHWIQQKAAAGALVLFESRHEDNPVLFDPRSGAMTEEGRRTMAVLDSLTGIRLQRLRYGRWVAAEGLVYDDFDRAVHVLSFEQLVSLGIALPREKQSGPYLCLNPDKVRRVVASQDWGYTNPGVLQAWALDADRRAYLVHEIYRTGETIDWWLSQAKAVHAHYHIAADSLFCDPSEPSFIEQERRAKLPAVKADNAIVPGIQAVKDRLKVAGDGRPRLYVYDRALQDRDPALLEQHAPCGLLEEVSVHVWARRADGTISKEEPLDRDNHGCDAARYMAMGVDGPRKDKRVRSW